MLFIESGERAATVFWERGFHLDDDSGKAALEAFSRDYPEGDEQARAAYTGAFLDWIRAANDRLETQFWEDWCRESCAHDDGPESPGP